MDRVTTFSSYNSVINSLMQTEQRLNTADTQVSSGKVSSDLQGYGVNAETLTAAQTLKTQVDGFVLNAQSLTSKLDSQNLALTDVADAGTGARGAVASAIANGSADGLMATLQSYFSQAAGGLNTKYNGQYLFAGGQVNTAPVAAQTLADLTTPPVGGIFQNDQLATVSKLDETSSIQSGVLASNVGTPLFNALATIEAYNQGPNGPLTGTLTQAQSDFLTTTLSTFDSVNQGLTNTVASNGLVQNRVDQTLTQQQDRQTSLTIMIGGITDVDMAQASSNLSQAQVALQASARIFSSLQTNSLLNYLSTPAAV